MQKIDVIEYLPTIIGELKKGILINTKKKKPVGLFFSFCLSLFQNKQSRL